jgi:lambda repressor-like predicted transcriptional regulator
MSLASKQLEEFVRQQCKEKGLSLRGLSTAAGLSPSTLHNLISRQYQPSIFSLNRLADFLGVRREYLWQLAGLLDDMDYGPDVPLTDPRLKFYFARVDKLPENARNLIINMLKALADYFQPSDNKKASSTD